MSKSRLPRDCFKNDDTRRGAYAALVHVHAILDLWAIGAEKNPEEERTLLEVAEEVRTLMEPFRSVDF